MSASVTTRFAPSPTGRLHLGHAYSAVFAHQLASETGGKFLLRVEDIDFTRCRPEFIDSLLEDLNWLGLNWEPHVRKQSEHLDDYARSVRALLDKGLLYPCFCTRKDIQREIRGAVAAPHGPEGPLYPGTCRLISESEREARIADGQDFAWRLDLQRAMLHVGAPLTWYDRAKGLQVARPQLLGDVVLVRKDIGCSYHLAVVHDDAMQEITLVTRGEDLFEATHLHRLLQALLDLPVPEYQHHALLCDEHGRRLAKRDLAQTLHSMRESGLTPADVLSQIRRP